MHGARAVMMRRANQAPGLRQWLEKLALCKHHNVAIVALANKLARIAWQYSPETSLIGHPC